MQRETAHLYSAAESTAERCCRSTGAGVESRKGRGGRRSGGPLRDQSRALQTVNLGNRHRVAMKGMMEPADDRVMTREEGRDQPGAAVASPSFLKTQVLPAFTGILFPSVEGSRTVEVYVAPI